MNYIFTQATYEDLNQVYVLINARMDWMVTKGIKQWEHHHYWSVYPKSYYESEVEKGHMYVLKMDNIVVGAIILYEEDERWGNDEVLNAYYLHNFVTSLDYPGVGKTIISEVEKLAKMHHKEAVRLDCMVTNQFLNGYYESLGYPLVGECFEGIYHGNKREKKLR